MPTFRLGYSASQGDKNLTNLFGFEEFNEREFNNYLENNGIVLIYKLHPNEEPYLSKYINNLNPELEFFQDGIEYKVFSKKNKRYNFIWL